MVKVLITGASGLLGKYLLSQIPKRCIVYAGYRTVKPATGKTVKIDITDKKSVVRIVKQVLPQVMIHAASQGNVDYCEKHRQEAKAINQDATLELFRIGQKINAKFVFFSTNAIYDGENPPYNEDSALRPVDYYGLLKKRTEEELFKIARKDELLVIRLMTMFGWNNPKERQNPVTWMIGELKAGKKLHLVNDVYNNFLYAKDAARTVWQLLKQNQWGKFNIAGGEILSRYQLGRKVAKVFQLPERNITNVSSNYFTNLAPRPKNTSFDISKIKRIINFRPTPVAQALEDMKRYER